MFDILSTRGYKLHCRGTVDVKGKGNMVTYFLDGVGETAPSEGHDIYAVSTVTTLDLTFIVFISLYQLHIISQLGS